MVSPMSHFFVFHWLQFTSMRCFFHIGYLPKPTSMGGRISHQSPSLIMSIGQGDIPIVTLLLLSSAGWSCQHSRRYKNTCRAWWDSSNLSHLINLSVDNIWCVQTCRSRIYITMTRKYFLYLWPTFKNRDRVSSEEVNLPTEPVTWCHQCMHTPNLSLTNWM